MNLWHFNLLVLFVHCETLFKICLCVFVLSNPTSFSGCPFIIMHIQHIYFMWLLIVIYDYTNMDVQHHFLKTANLSPEWNQFNHMQKLGSKKKCCFLFVSGFFLFFLGGVGGTLQTERYIGADDFLKSSYIQGISTIDSGTVLFFHHVL